MSSFISWANLVPISLFGMLCCNSQLQQPAVSSAGFLWVYPVFTCHKKLHVPLASHKLIMRDTVAMTLVLQFNSAYSFLLLNRIFDE